MELYIGRTLGIGLTKEGREAVVYAVLARSEENKIRIAERYRTRVFIDSPLLKTPVEELTEGKREVLEKQKAQAEFIFYNGISVHIGGYPPFAVVSNGKHTDSIAKRYKGSSDDSPTVVRHVLNRWGPELDGPNKTPQTPRIAGLLEVGLTEYTLGIVSKPGEAKVFAEQLNKGIKGLSTYAGNPNNPREMVINHNPSLIALPAEGKTPQQLADDIFDWVPRDFVVCTAAGVWNPERKKWELAVRNLYS